jgi:hypothetical protein
MKEIVNKTVKTMGHALAKAFIPDEKIGRQIANQYFERHSWY